MVTTNAHAIAGDRDADREPTRNILIAIHGHEAPGWSRQAARALPRQGVIRVLVVRAPAPASTSLLPAARRRHEAAVADLRQAERARNHATLEPLLADLPPAEVLEVRAPGDPGRIVATHARTWPADVVVIGRDTRGRVLRALLGAVHESVVRHAGCAVLVIPGGARPARRARGLPLPFHARAWEEA